MQSLICHLYSAILIPDIAFLYSQKLHLLFVELNDVD